MLWSGLTKIYIVPDSQGDDVGLRCASTLAFGFHVKGGGGQFFAGHLVSPCLVAQLMFTTINKVDGCVQRLFKKSLHRLQGSARVRMGYRLQNIPAMH